MCICIYICIYINMYIYIYLYIYIYMYTYDTLHFQTICVVAHPTSYLTRHV